MNFLSWDTLERFRLLLMYNAVPSWYDESMETKIDNKRPMRKQWRARYIDAVRKHLGCAGVAVIYPIRCEPAILDYILEKLELTYIFREISERIDSMSRKVHDDRPFVIEQYESKAALMQSNMPFRKLLMRQCDVEANEKFCGPNNVFLQPYNGSMDLYEGYQESEEDVFYDCAEVASTSNGE